MQSAAGESGAEPDTRVGRGGGGGAGAVARNEHGGDAGDDAGGDEGREGCGGWEWSAGCVGDGGG